MHQSVNGSIQANILIMIQPADGKESAGCMFLFIWYNHGCQRFFLFFSRELQLAVINKLF